MTSQWLQRQSAFAADHPLLVQMLTISACVTAFFVVGYAAAKRWLDAAMQRLRKLEPLEGASGFVAALLPLYAISAEWLGHVAGIPRASLLRYVFPGWRLTSDLHRSLHALWHVR